LVENLELTMQVSTDKASTTSSRVEAKKFDLPKKEESASINAAASFLEGTKKKPTEGKIMWCRWRWRC
jgi:hypothetical protein